MNSQKQEKTRYLTMWDMTGLECIINVSDILAEHDKWEKDTMWRTLKGDPLRNIKPPGVPLDQMILRARVNSQRHYEIYTFDSEMSEDDIREMFETEPQVIVDAIRNVGHKLYSDRAIKKTQVIV